MMVALEADRLATHTLPQGFGVPGFRAATCEELVALLREALARQGPTLIEATL